jgi:hypothetical protein
MSSFLTTSSTVMCPHRGMAILVTSNTIAVLPPGPILLLTDLHPIAGCTFAPGGVPSPCLSIRWLTGTLQSTINGIPALLDSSVGLCLNVAGLPQGTAVVVQTQSEAVGF